jgi:hypothetical protein
MNPYTRNLELAILSGNGERINRETERLMQAIANDLSAVTRKYGTGSAFHGLILAVVDSFAASLRLIADEQDLAIAEELSKHLTACTIDTREGKK